MGVVRHVVVPGRFVVAVVLAAALGGVAACSSSGDPVTRPDAAALRAAAAAGDGPLVGRLLAAGTPVDEADGDGRTALLEAVASDHTTVAGTLLEAGADVNAQATNRDTPWLLAGASGRTEILRLMLSKGPDLSIRNRFGGNALIPACERAHVDTVRFLLAESDIDVDHVNDLGWTCLLEAVILGDGGADHQEVVRLVLAAGADPDLADREGVTPLAHARRAGQDAVVALLVAAGATG